MEIRYPDAIEVHRPRTLWRDVLVGVAAGVVGTWAMERFQAGMSRAEEAVEHAVADDDAGGGDAVARDEAEGAEAADEGDVDDGPLDDIAVFGPYHREDESSPETAVRVLHRKVTGWEPEAARRAELADRLHWAQGMAMGGLYGLFRGDRRSGLDLTGGALFGAGVWVAADELAVPVLGLAEGPTAHGPEAHAKSLAAHVVYGLVTATAAQLLSRAT